MEFPVLLNGEPATGLPWADRGFAYGDGVFETLRITQRQPVLWALHWDRLLLGCNRLGIGLGPNFRSTLESWVQDLLGRVQADQGIVKIVVTRGCGGRGYRPADTTPNVVLSYHPLPDDLARVQQVAALKNLAYRLVPHPVLNGLKHLNRLDQVLASQELSSEDEGIMLNGDGWVIEGTKTNLLFAKQGRLITPDLCNCGVAGVMRRYLLEQGKEHQVQIEVEKVALEHLAGFDGIAIMNSVLGICLVSQLDRCEMPRSGLLANLQQSVHQKLGL